MLKKFALTLCLLLVVIAPIAAMAQDEEWVEFTSSDGSVTLSHPSHWVIEEDMGMAGGVQLNLATTQELLENDDAPVQGEVALAILFIPVETFAMVVPDLDPASETFLSEAATGLADYIREQMVAEATAEPEVTAAPEVTATEEPAVEGTEEAMELPFTATLLDDGNVMLEFTESGNVFYGHELGDFMGADTDVVTFEAAEGVIGVVLVAGAHGETDEHLVMDVLTVIDSIVYTPAAE